MQSALGDAAAALALPGSVATAIGQVTGALVRALRERRQTVRALAGCARLADLLETEPDLEALSHYPHLLTYEFARLPVDKAVVPVVLLDTFEDTGDRTHRDLERLIQRVVWLMPNAFFVIAGLSRLQWADAALEGQLDWTGPQAWPGLDAPAVPHARTAPGGVGRTARQLLIGDFSPEDCDDYLARRLTRDNEPLIGAGLRQVSTRRSHGLPLYLDLAGLRFLEFRRGGRTPEPADFEYDFPALIARTIRDLLPDERHVLRSVVPCPRRRPFRRCSHGVAGADGRSGRGGTEDRLPRGCRGQGPRSRVRGRHGSCAGRHGSSGPADCRLRTCPPQQRTVRGSSTLSRPAAARFPGRGGLPRRGVA
ncbi:ATP/GTP-binding protein [Streptomyces chrestomyceticus JCM 4735]|uniref:ATP/GTP-binding protein n=1 Tax=Streptomyces chrestomyceticus JCM 4735 TaxID=1306181 RepID=A0A7U9KPC6_9ACTN|nr:hypothetical protein [Streptomyces chrestomyceticus]GCD32899.1 ATP/GTP-binding protein [Streptomyces chrestomyceticus JCM 4735]